MKIKSNYIKSPMNYSGGKFKLLNQIMPLLPNDIKVFVDLFAGGCNVGANVIANKIICNDISSDLINFYKYIVKENEFTILQHIEEKIKEYNLSKMNKEGYIRLREHYNKSRHPLELYLLSCYSFNYRIRFNANNDFNEAFGKNRSSYNETLKTRLVAFISRLKEKILILLILILKI